MPNKYGIPDEIWELLKNTPPQKIRMVTATISNKKSEDKMSFVEFEIILVDSGLLSNSAKITIGNKRFIVSLLPTKETDIYLTSPIPFELGDNVGVYTIDGTIEFSLNDKNIKEYFSTMAINSINLKK